MGRPINLEDFGKKINNLLEMSNLPLENYGVSLILHQTNNDMVTINWRHQQPPKSFPVQFEKDFNIDLFLEGFLSIVSQLNLLLREAGISIFIHESKFGHFANYSKYTMSNGMVIRKVVNEKEFMGYVQLILHQGLVSPQE